MKSILIIEDDTKIASLIELYCEREGYAVHKAANLDQAEQLLEQHRPDLVILDLMLPGSPDQDGTYFLKKIRQDSGLPVIIVSAKAEEIDRVLGLELGADDYVTKPFSPKELMARIKAVLRRAEQSSIEKKSLKVGEIEINLDKIEAKHRSNSLSLTKKEFFLLAALAQHPERVFSRSQLIKLVYDHGEDDIYDRTIDVHIANLRKKLGDDKQKIIQTVTGLGYKLAGNCHED